MRILALPIIALLVAALLVALALTLACLPLIYAYVGATEAWAWLGGRRVGAVVYEEWV